MPQVRLEEEVQHEQGLPVVAGVGHVHMVAGADHARVNLVGGVRIAVHVLHDRVAVGPHGVPVQHGELLVAGDAVVQPEERRAHKRGGVRAAVGAGIHGRRARLGGPAVGSAALAAGGVDGAHHGAGGHDGATVLRGHAVMLDGQAVVDAAVGDARIVAGGPLQAGVGQQLRVHLGDLAHLLGGEALQVLGPNIPHRASLMGGAVLQLHIEFAVHGRVDERVELGEVVHLAGLLRLVVTQTGEILVEVARGLLPILALPVGLAHLRVRLPVGPAVVQLVEHEVALRVAVAFDLPVHHGRVDVGLGEQAGLVGVGVAAVLHRLLVAGRIHVRHHDERRVRPTFQELPVAQVVLQDEVAPAERQRVVGAGAQRQPVLGGTSQVRLARVHRDEGVGATGDVHHGAGGVVVVRLRLLGGPLHELRGVVDQLGPRPGLHVVDTAGEVARALAHLVGGHDVRGAEQKQRHAGIGLHAPLTARAAPGEGGLVAVLRGDLQDVVGDGLVGLVPGNAHPAGIVVALGVRALHGVLDAVGVVGRLNGRLALGAVVAHGEEAVLVALGANDLAVLHVHPHAALHLAAAAAAGADARDRRFGGGGVLVLGESSGGAGGAGNGSHGGRHGGGLDERPARHVQLAHFILLLFFRVLSLESLEVPLGRRHLTSFSDVHVTRLGWHKEFPKMPG